jgi:hypothetical protein
VHLKKSVALLGAIILIVLASSVPAVAAGGAKVTVRVEGLSRTLLAPTTVKTHTGSITTGGTPRGACPATSAAGALDVATHHRWGGTYNQTYRDLELTSILGETHTFTSPYYW